eukprot:58183-Amphidinium_carterae.1
MKDKDFPTFEHYSLAAEFRRKGIKGGGSAVLVRHPAVSSFEAHVDSTQAFELIMGTLQINHQIARIAAVYVPPARSTYCPTEEHHQHMLDVIAQYKPHLVVGDTNAEGIPWREEQWDALLDV